MDVTCIPSTNETNDISMNDDANLFHKYYVTFNHQITTKIYLQEYNKIKKNSDFVIIKCYFGFIVKKTKEF